MTPLTEDEIFNALIDVAAEHNKIKKGEPPKTAEELGIDPDLLEQFANAGLVKEVRQPEFHGIRPYPPRYVHTDDF